MREALLGGKVATQFWFITRPSCMKLKRQEHFASFCMFQTQFSFRYGSADRQRPVRHAHVTLNLKDLSLFQWEPTVISRWCPMYRAPCLVEKGRLLEIPDSVGETAGRTAVRWWEDYFGEAIGRCAGSARA